MRNVKDFLNILTTHVMSVRNKQTVSEINRGDCWLWALLAHKNIDGSKIYSALNKHRQGHAFISLDGLFYDSESLDGVADWNELGFFKRLLARGLNNFFSLCDYTEMSDRFLEEWTATPGKDAKDLKSIQCVVSLGL